MHLKPLYDRIVVEMLNRQEYRSKTGLTMTRDMSLSKNTVLKGRVVAVGQGRLLENGDLLPLKVKEGDLIIFSKMQGESYNDGSVDYTILSEAHILAIVEEDQDENN